MPMINVLSDLHPSEDVLFIPKMRVNVRCADLIEAEISLRRTGCKGLAAISQPDGQRAVAKSVVLSISVQRRLPHSNREHLVKVSMDA